MMSAGENLAKQYEARFSDREQFRIAVWKILVEDFFARLIPHDSALLDLGCGWGEFINHASARRKYGMDLNPDCSAHLDSAVEFLNQDCTNKWDLPDESLDMVFTSNFFEHLPSKESLDETLHQASRCLKADGQIICLGPNIKFLGGQYWDFYDHYLPLTEMSLSEALQLNGFEVAQCIDRFLPYSMSTGRPMPLSTMLLKMYLRLPLAWRVFGKQFLVIGRKRRAD